MFSPFSILSITIPANFSHSFVFALVTDQTIFAFNPPSSWVQSSLILFSPLPTVSVLILVIVPVARTFAVGHSNRPASHNQFQWEKWFNCNSYSFLIPNINYVCKDFVYNICFNSSFIGNYFTLNCIRRALALEQKNSIDGPTRTKRSLDLLNSCRRLPPHSKPFNVQSGSGTWGEYKDNNSYRLWSNTQHIHSVVVWGRD